MIFNKKNKTIFSNGIKVEYTTYYEDNFRDRVYDPFSDDYYPPFECCEHCKQYECEIERQKKEIENHKFDVKNCDYYIVFDVKPTDSEKEIVLQCEKDEIDEISSEHKVKWVYYHHNQKDYDDWENLPPVEPKKVGCGDMFTNMNLNGFRHEERIK